MVIADLLDEILLVEVPENFSSYGSVDLEFITDNGDGEIQELGCLLGDSLVCLGIEEDSVVNLFLYLDLGPALLLGLSTTLLVYSSGGGFILATLCALGVFTLLLLGALKIH